MRRLPRGNRTKFSGELSHFLSLGETIEVSGEESTRARLPRRLLPVHPLHKETGEWGPADPEGTSFSLQIFSMGMGMEIFVRLEPI